MVNVSFVVLEDLLSCRPTIIIMLMTFLPQCLSRIVATEARTLGFRCPICRWDLILGYFQKLHCPRYQNYNHRHRLQGADHHPAWRGGRPAPVLPGQPAAGPDGQVDDLVALVDEDDGCDDQEHLRPGQPAAGLGGQVGRRQGKQDHSDLSQERERE